MIAILSGLLAGSLHVLSGPDHLAAVAPLTLRTPRAGSALGALWGIGHGGGILLWLGMATMLRRVSNVELPGAALEALVGVSLLGLGALALFGEPAHEHDHAHGARRGRLTALGMGALHGSAGAGHLFAVLPTLGLSSAGALQYASGYMLAGIVAMASVGSLVGRLGERLHDRVRVRRMFGFAVAALGAIWLVEALADLRVWG